MSLSRLPPERAREVAVARRCGHGGLGARATSRGRSTTKHHHPTSELRRRTPMIRPLHFVLATAVAALTSACNGDDMDMDGMGGDGMMIPEVLTIPASEGPFEPAAAPDLDSVPNVVEVDLEAKVSEIEIAPGRWVSMWTYNGQLPGPRIEARAGDTVRV